MEMQKQFYQNYLVTGDAVKQLLLKAQSDAGLQTGNEEYENEINNFLSTFADKDNLGKDGFSLPTSVIRTVLEIANKYFIRSDGKVILIDDADEDKRNYNDSPRRISINDMIVGDFVNKVNGIDKTTIPGASNYDHALRFYMGHRLISGIKEYSVVVLPCLSPSDRDHTKDIEKGIFDVTGDDFALVISNSAKLISGNKSLWTQVLDLYDAGVSDTQLEFFSLAEFVRFRNGIDNRIRNNMKITFGRRSSKDMSINAIISFTDVGGADIPSRALLSGMTPVGIYFNQGDLIPPPPVSDKSF